MKLLLSIAMLLALSCSTTAKERMSELPTATKVDVSRYVGKWYAAAALPQFFSGKCIAQTAEYGIKSASEISVYNVCYKKNGRTTDIEGQASVDDKTTNARLTVTFNKFWTKLFKVKGEYVIIKLDENYKYVMVGNTSRKSLWIMARDTEMPQEVLKEYISIAKDLGFDTKKLVLSDWQ